MTACPKCGSPNIVGVEYWLGSPHHYDGVSEYDCRECGYRQGRWTEKELLDGFVEPRHGAGDEPVPVEE